MTTPRLNLIVIRSLEPERTVAFYRRLGIEFQQEQHGQGPLHFAAEMAGLVFEVYPAQSFADVDSTTRLGFAVEDIDNAVNSLRSAGVTIIQEPQKSKWGIRAVVRDPDGRAVELTQRPECA